MRLVQYIQKISQATLFGIACWGLLGCQSDNEPMELPQICPVVDTPEGLPQGWTTCGGTLNSVVTDFDENEETITRAGGSVTNSWNDGSKIYLTITNDSVTVPVVAVYSYTFSEWSFSFDATARIPEEGTLVAHYFKDAEVADFTSVSLNENSIIYTDSLAHYLYEDGTFMLSIHLKPAYLRMRFAGEPGQQFSFAGLNRYSSYNVSTGKMGEAEIVITQLTVSDTKENGKYYTPYVYGGVFGTNGWYLTGITDVVYSPMTLGIITNGRAYIRTLSEEELEKGQSVWLSIPSDNYVPKGWKHTSRGLIDEVKWSANVTDDQKSVIQEILYNMVKVEGGTFTMGATSEQGSDYYSGELPTHKVTLSDYYINQMEVTQKEWSVITGSSVSSWSSSNGYGDDYPAYYVTWNDCQTFIAKLNELSGLTFRLPTEAEWEYASRGGNKSKGDKYSGSDYIDDVAWYSSNSGSQTHPVATKSPNELALYDMSGNVWEWCQDWYGGYSSSAVSSPIGPTTGSYRVLRGGGWNDDATDCRVSRRYGSTPSFRNSGSGLRLAL